MNNKPWWCSYFSTPYRRLYEGPFKPELNTDHEVEMLRRIFANTKGPILDIGCGYGRHLHPLRKAGLPVFGIDYSVEMLKGNKAPDRMRIARADMRSLPFSDGSIEGVYLLFNSLGYFSDEENEGMLREIVRVLRPGGRLIFDAPLREGLRHNIRDTPSVLRSQKNFEIVENWSFDDATNRVTASGSWLTKDNFQEWSLSLRVYTPTELRKILKAAGFRGAVEIRHAEETEVIGTGEPASRIGTQTSSVLVLALKDKSG